MIKIMLFISQQIKSFKFELKKTKYELNNEIKYKNNKDKKIYKFHTSPIQ